MNQREPLKPEVVAIHIIQCDHLNGSCELIHYLIFLFRQDGARCYCDDVDVIDYSIYRSLNCITLCTGRPGQICGGTTSRSVYRVPSSEM